MVLFQKCGTSSKPAKTSEEHEDENRRAPSQSDLLDLVKRTWGRKSLNGLVVVLPGPPKYMTSWRSGPFLEVRCHQL